MWRNRHREASPNAGDGRANAVLPSMHWRRVEYAFRRLRKNAEYARVVRAFRPALSGNLLESALAAEETRSSSKHRSPSVAKATMMIAAYGPAEEAAENVSSRWCLEGAYL